MLFRAITGDPLVDHHYNSSGYYYHYYMTEQVKQPTGSRVDALLDQSSNEDRPPCPPSFPVDEDAKKFNHIIDVAMIVKCKYIHLVYRLVSSISCNNVISIDSNLKLHFE